MVMFNRILVVLAIVGAFLFGLRDGVEDAVNGHPEALWHAGTDEVDTVITDGTKEDVSTTFDYVANLTR